MDSRVKVSKEHEGDFLEVENQIFYHLFIKPEPCLCFFQNLRVTAKTMDSFRILIDDRNAYWIVATKICFGGELGGLYIKNISVIVGKHFELWRFIWVLKKKKEEKMMNKSTIKLINCLINFLDIYILN